MDKNPNLKYPIGVQSFDVLRKNGFLYVDKSDLIYKLAQQHICFLCRPRRFGKSLTLSTLEAYFSGRKELFEGLKITQLEQDWLKYPIFHIDFNGSIYSQPEGLHNKIESRVRMWEREYGIQVESEDLGERFAYVLQQAHRQTGRACVVLVDEYDKPLLDVLGDKQENNNREILKGFYSVFKLADEDLRFVMLTGVTKFSQVSIFSGFNQPQDISMNSDYETLCGITEDELTEYFSSSIAEMAQAYHYSVEEMHSWLKKYYDGYHFSDNLTDIYNPFSLLNVFANRNVRDYWFASGTPTYLIKLMDSNNVDIETILSRYYTPEYFIDYRANREDPLAMLYQSGYLTIKEVRYEGFDTFYRLDFPNNEVKRGFVTLLYDNYFQNKDYGSSIIRQMVNSLKEADLTTFRNTLTAYLSSIDYTMRKDKEYHFQYTLYLIFSLMSTYNVKVERHNSQGRADMIVETDKHIYIFEFKLNGTADEAIRQIETTGYALPYQSDRRTLHKIGISFGKKSGTIDDWKEA